MPLGNQTGMTDDERDALGRWVNGMQAAGRSAQLARAMSLASRLRHLRRPGASGPRWPGWSWRFCSARIAAIVGYSLWLQGGRAPTATSFDGDGGRDRRHRVASRSRSRCWRLPRGCGAGDAPTYLGARSCRGAARSSSAMACRRRARSGRLDCLLLISRARSGHAVPGRSLSNRPGGGLRCCGSWSPSWSFAPIGEEIAFRGFLYRGLVRTGSRTSCHRR